MKTFIGIKRVLAEACVEAKPSASDPLAQREPRPGYRVTYEDGYTSWSPADAFEDAYQQIEVGCADIAVKTLRTCLTEIIKQHERDNEGIPEEEHITFPAPTHEHPDLANWVKAQDRTIIEARTEAMRMAVALSEPRFYPFGGATMGANARGAQILRPAAAVITEAEKIASFILTGETADQPATPQP